MLRRPSAAVATSREGHRPPRLDRVRIANSNWRSRRPRPHHERAAFRETLQIEFHGRELSDHERRRVAERAWQNFLRYGWLMHTTPHQIHVGRGQRTANISTTNFTRIPIPNG